MVLREVTCILSVSHSSCCHDGPHAREAVGRDHQNVPLGQPPEELEDLLPLPCLR